MPVQQARLPIAAGGSSFGARAAIGLEFERRGLPPFGFGPRFDLLAARLAQAPPAEGATVDIEDIRLGHVTRDRVTPPIRQ